MKDYNAMYAMEFVKGGLIWKTIFTRNKPQQEGITTKPGYKELFILILQKAVIIIRGFIVFR